MVRYVLAMLVMTTSAMAQDTGLALWGKIYEVFSHPRCANCHVGPDNVPMWSGPEYGPEARPHGMNITGGGEDRPGVEHIACSSCHTQRNSPLPHGPPGTPVWGLPPISMEWFGKSSAEICAQIKDPMRNGRRTIIPDVSEHIKHEALVAWGWDPGPGREPAPYSKDQLVAFLQQWDKAGAPCPAR
jgi:hypothetical protein